MHIIKKIFFFIATSSNCCVSAKFFLMLVEMHYFGGVINSKTYLNLELGSKFFLLLLYSLEYKLMNLLVFEEKNHEQELFFLLLVWDLTLPLNLKSVVYTLPAPV